MFEFRSRQGNAVLGIAGGLYAVAAMVLLIDSIAVTWGAASLMDRALQFALLCIAVASVFLIRIAVINLGPRRRNASEPPRLPPDHRAAAAARS